MKTAKTYWFGPKRVGVGYGPRTWQGWVAIGVYALSMILVQRAIGSNGDHTMHVVSMAAVTFAFLILFFWKLDRSGK